MSKEKKLNLMQEFLRNLVIVSIINSGLAIFFLKGFDNMANPFGLLVSISVACAVVVTAIRRKQTV